MLNKSIPGFFSYANSKGLAVGFQNQSLTATDYDSVALHCGNVDLISVS